MSFDKEVLGKLQLLMGAYTDTFADMCLHFSQQRTAVAERIMKDHGIDLSLCEVAEKGFDCLSPMTLSGTALWKVGTECNVRIKPSRYSSDEKYVRPDVLDRDTDVAILLLHIGGYDVVLEAMCKETIQPLIEVDELEDLSNKQYICACDIQNVLYQALPEDAEGLKSAMKGIENTITSYVQSLDPDTRYSELFNRLLKENIVETET